VTAQFLAETPFILINQGDISSAKAKAGRAEEAYSVMNYTDAVKNSIDALLSAARARSVGGGFIPVAALRAIQAIGTFVLGVLIAYFVFRRKGKARVPATPMHVPHVSHCHTCGKQLTWINEYGRWYCFTCRKYQ
jgi:cbb3-type cytochrome oxidase subunit 3